MKFDNTAPKAPPASTQNEHLTVMSTGHYQALREALYKKDFRDVDGVPWPTATLKKGNAIGHAQLRPLAIDDQPFLTTEEVETWARIMWRQREELSDLDADVMDALSTLWLTQAKTPRDRAVAEIDEILGMRGLKPKRNGQGYRGGYEPEQRVALLRALAHIQNLWLNMAEVEVYEDGSKGRRRRPAKHAIQSRAFVITDRMGQLRLDGQNIDVQKFIFRPGEVFGSFLFGPGRQTALLSAMALRYDPHNQYWEKRLTRYLSWLWRNRAKGSEYLQPYRIGTLLEAVGDVQNPRYPSRVKERLEKALDTLQSDGVIAAWQYDRWDESTTETRGWMKQWLQGTVLIEPPEAVQSAYQNIEGHEAPRRLPAAGGPLADRVRRRRQEQGLSQLLAADQLGITQAYLSMIERGKVSESKLSSALQKKLHLWLG